MTGKQLQRRRKNLGLSLSELSAIWGISKNTLWRYEDGRIPIIHEGLFEGALRYLEASKSDEEGERAARQTKSSKPSKKKARPNRQPARKKKVD